MDKKYCDMSPWSQKLSGITSRCGTKGRWHYKKGIKNFLTTADLKYLWLRDNAPLMKKPSIDRIDSKGNYTLENCRFIEFSLNMSLAKRKLDEQKVIEIRTLYAQGNILQTELAKMFNVSKTCIWDVVHNDNWKSLKLAGSAHGE